RMVRAASTQRPWPITATAARAKQRPQSHSMSDDLADTDRDCAGKTSGYPVRRPTPREKAGGSAKCNAAAMPVVTVGRLARPPPGWYCRRQRLPSPGEPATPLTRRQLLQSAVAAGA